jgi:mono/diheme cytochrome c family protein
LTDVNGGGSCACDARRVTSKGADMARTILIAIALAAAVPVSAADGAAVYAKHCASCHGPDGQGGTGKAVRGKSAAFIKEVVEFHPPPMDKIKLSAADTDAVATYLAGSKK